MIDEKEVRKLAALARIKISDEETGGIARDLGKILDYARQIEKAGDISEKPPEIFNIFREDGNPHESGKFSEDLLEAAPNRKGDYFAVKKIL